MDNEKKQVTYNSSFSGETQVTLDIQQYMNNKAMYIGLMCNEDGYDEPFGDVTVNLSVAAPNYCGYLKNSSQKMSLGSLQDLHRGVVIVNILFICSMSIS